MYLFAGNFEEFGATDHDETMNPDRKRKRWIRELPAFLDAASSVSATTYGARRLPELKALWRQVQPAASASHRAIDEPFQSAGHKTSTRHLRRRTTSYKSRKRHRYPTGKPIIVDNETSSETTTTTEKKPSRKARRKPAMLRNEHSGWQQQQRLQESDNKMHWLPTHLWHAKRFHMHDMFGWRIPLQHTNRGSRATERLLRQGRTLLQDITWRMQPIILGTDNLKSLLGCMTRLCATFLPKSHAESIIEGKCFGAGILHEPDAFPSKAIGPAKWWIRSTSWKEGGTHEMYLFLHPSIRPRVEEILGELVRTTSSVNDPAMLDGGLACFQLRGESASQMICEAIKLTEEHVQTTTSMSHLSAVSVVKGIDTQSSLQSTGIRPFDLGKDEIILVRHDDRSENNTGWDLICPVSDAHDIFLALVHHRSAVPVGSAEECHMDLACNRAVFPAAFPDSEQGRKYWEGDVAWKVLRSVCESGRGRLQKVSSSQEANNGNNALLTMSDLEKIASRHDDDDELDESNPPVVVRGLFGQPFVDLLQQCARLPSQASSSTKERRPRRKRSVDGIRVACLVSTEEAQGRMDRVASFANSLSLAALIRCKIQVYGGGTLVPGDSINGNGEVASDSTRLGVVVEGSFSGSKGMVQGFGFVGAARLLAFLGSCPNPAMMANEGELCLVVEMSRETGTTCQGILSLLL